MAGNPDILAAPIEKSRPAIHPNKSLQQKAKKISSSRRTTLATVSRTLLIGNGGTHHLQHLLYYPEGVDVVLTINYIVLR